MIKQKMERGKKDTEITFSYLTTEYDMNGKFECKCGSPMCHKSLQGFKYLSPENKAKLKYRVAPHLKKYY